MENVPENEAEQEGDITERKGNGRDKSERMTEKAQERGIGRGSGRTYLRRSVGDG